MLLAVLEKRAGLRLGQHDVFLNIAGGLRLDDPALDAAVCAAVVSSLNDLPIAGDVCLAAEVGLSGEMRAVPRLEQRLAEAQKLGFREMYVSQFNGRNLAEQDLAPACALKGHAVSRLDEVLQRFIWVRLARAKKQLDHQPEASRALKKTTDHAANGI